MNDPTKLYDDLVALRRAQWVTEEFSKHTAGELDAVIERTEGRLREELKVLHEDEREEVLDALVEFYDESARVELEGLL